MSYTKHTWVDGEVITADKLNNIEEGIEGVQESEPAPSAFIVNIEQHEDTYYYLDKTWREIYDAFLAGPVWIVQLTTDSGQYPTANPPYTWTSSSYDMEILDSIWSDEFSYELITSNYNHYYASNENDYPSTNGGR